MKKIAKYLLPTFLLGIGIMFGFNSNVKAAPLDMGIYQGSSAPPGTGFNKGDCSSVFGMGHYLCRFRLANNGQQYGIRISFVYIDTEKGVYQQLGDSWDIWKTEPYFSQGIRTTPSGSGSKVNQSSLSISSFSASGYTARILSNMQYNSSWLKQKFYDEEYLGALANQMIPGVSNGLKDSYWDQFETEFADAAKPAKKGLRFFIEPIRGYASSDGSYYVMTLSEYARFYEGSGKQMQKYWNRSNSDGGQEEWLFMLNGVEFLDVGVYPVVPCSSNACTSRDVYTINKGHALQIIDFSRFIKNECDYESGTGFPKDKPRGEKLTEQEEKCCTEKLEEIKNKYKTSFKTPQQCMMVSDSVPTFINCMEIYFSGTQEQAELWQKEKEELLEFDQRYPACSQISCNFQELISIEETYIRCITSMDTVTWMHNVIECKDTTCEINYRRELYMYKEKYERCDLTEWEKKLATHTCTQTIVCEEDNPNHFPKDGCAEDADLSCCTFFEDRMKEAYAAQGLTQPEIDKLINDWFNEPGKEFRQNCFCDECNINDAELTEHCCEELKQKYPDKPEEFWKAKGCEKDENDKCKWHVYADELIKTLLQMVGADCSLGTASKIEAEDTNEWDCIFDSDNIKRGTREEIFIDYYLKYSNPYCAVYCREVVGYDFPHGNMVVKAGTHFTVGETGHAPEWKHIKFESTRYCQTSGSTRDDESDKIDTKRFEKDWENANNRVITTWDDWKIAQQQDYAIVWAEHGEDFDCDLRCVETKEVCHEDEDGEEECEDVCVRSEYFGYIMHPIEVSYARYGESERDVTPSSWCSSTEEPPWPDTDARAKSHQQAKNDMETVETDIHACTSWNAFGNYKYAEFSSTNVKALRYSKYQTYNDFKDYIEFSPEVTLYYDEPTYDAYDFTGLLGKDIESSVKENNFSVTGKTFTIKYDCPNTVAPGHRTCVKRKKFDYSPQEKTEATYYKKVTYKLRDGVFNTILKPQGIAVHGGTGMSSGQIAIDLGYSALHVHFMTPSGRYYIGLSYKGFSSYESLAEEELKHNFDKLVTSPYEYDCTYIVNNEIIENDDPNCEGDNCFPCKTDNCDPTGNSLKGLNIIYRPISLGEPFPGINGEGRVPGSNWGDETLIRNFITNNRGVNGTAVYQKAPMYQITLTPALIQKIRKYNETTTYNDFNMDCMSDGKECKSYFIRENVGDSSYNFSKYFQKCTTEGKGGSTTCCGVGNWNDCDEQDGITRRR